MKIEGMSNAGVNTSYTPEVVSNGYTPDISSEPVETVEKQPMIGAVIPIFTWSPFISRMVISTSLLITMDSFFFLDNANIRLPPFSSEEYRKH